MYSNLADIITMTGGAFEHKMSAFGMVVFKIPSKLIGS